MALALHLGRTQLEVANDFCTRIAGVCAMPASAVQSVFPEPRIPEMDKDFTMEELDASLAASRRSSSPGPHGVTYAALPTLKKRPEESC